MYDFNINKYINNLNALFNAITINVHSTEKPKLYKIYTNKGAKQNKVQEKALTNFTLPEAWMSIVTIWHIVSKNMLISIILQNNDDRTGTFTSQSPRI